MDGIINYKISILENIHKLFHECKELLGGIMPGGSGGSAHGVMVIVVGNVHGNTSSNPGRDWLHFT